ncbi:MAG: SDR family oxidoreductase [Chlorobi bacterium]|nr:SDR family oxidoreductase [Chlorobiota bacterium]
MDLKIKDKLFIVCGATGGLGNGAALNLINEGAKIIAIARDARKLNAFKNRHPDQIEIVLGDISKTATIQETLEKLGDRFLDGVLINAGGPPAKSFLETEMADWDNAYNSILRWKVEFTKAILPIFIKQEYGRIVYIESSSTKQPIANLVLSNSLRLAVVGFAKTLSQEIATKGVTLNILAPGFHETHAAKRLFVKRSEVEGITIEEAKARYESNIPIGKMGDANEFGSIAAWLLSPVSKYITGQTISVDGGAIRGTFG